jgi:hypothetical protein
MNFRPILAVRHVTVSFFLIALIAGHVFSLHYLWSRADRPISIALGVVLLLAIKLSIVVLGRQRS